MTLGASPSHLEMPVEKKTDHTSMPLARNEVTEKNNYPVHVWSRVMHRSFPVQSMDLMLLGFLGHRHRYCNGGS